LGTGDRKGRQQTSLPPAATAPLLDSTFVVRLARGLAADPSACEGETPLIGAIRRNSAPTEGISAGRIYEILREFFMQVASALQERGKRADARLIARASTHWLRHTCGAIAIARGVRTETVAQNFGHSSRQTS
jgi:hypothetical protein